MNKFEKWARGLYIVGTIALILKYMSYFTFETIGSDDGKMGTSIWTGIEDEGWIWVFIFLIYMFAGVTMMTWYNKSNQIHKW